ncbi:hypothetical protein Tco_0148113 [Tanacetum coccineum]
MSLGCSARIADVAAMSDVAFRKRFRSYYDSSPSPALPVRKRNRGTSELILGTDSEEEEEEEVEESSDYDSKSEGAEDEGPAAGDEGPIAGDKSIATGDEDPGMREPLRLGYGALRHRELALEEDYIYSTFEVGHVSGFAPEPERPERVSAFRQPTLTIWTYPEDSTVYIDVPTYPSPAPPVHMPPSPEWSSDSLPISIAHSGVSSPILSPMISLTVPSPIVSPVATPTATILVDED